MAKVQPRLCCMGVDIPLDEHTEHRIMELQSMAEQLPPRVKERTFQDECEDFMPEVVS